MQYIIKTILLPIIAAVLSVMPMSNAVAAGAIWVGVDGNSDTSLVYYFAHGYADISSASTAAETACDGEQTACINQFPVGNGGLSNNQAYAVYSNFVHGDAYRGGTAEGTTLADARGFALQTCNGFSSGCREELAVQDSGNSNPQIMRITVQYTVPTSGGGGGGSSAGAIIGGIAVVGLGVWLYNANTPDLPDAESSFIPVAHYAENNGIRNWSVGGRLDWQKGQMSAFWQASESSQASGLQYAGDFWTAAFSESVRSETADYDFSLSADFGGRIWKLSPVYRLHSQYKNGETKTDNALNLEAALSWNRWTVRPSAGFQWENTDEFGDNVRLRVGAAHRF